MTVSIVIPLYNGKKYINGILDIITSNKNSLSRAISGTICIDIIFVNDYPDEIIENDESTDVPYYVINHKRNEGIHKSRIDGLKHAKGEYILFLDQDDMIESDYLLTQLEIIESKKADWVISNGIFRTNRLIYGDETSVADLLDESHYFLSLTDIISPGQVLMKREIIPDLWCDCILKNNYCDDAFLWMLLKDRGYKLAYNDRVVYYHNESNNNTSFSWKNNTCALKELRDIINEKQCVKSTFLNLFNVTIDKEIKKQELYGKLEDKYDLLCMRDNVQGFHKIFGNSKVIIYGYGIWGRRLYKMMESASVKITRICDIHIQGSVDGVDVCLPSEIFSCDLDFENVLILITAPAEKEEIQMSIIRGGHIRCISIVELFDMLLENSIVEKIEKMR